MAALELINSNLFNDPNLVAYWRFEGNSNDSKDSNNGTNTSIVYSSGNGMFGQGAGFSNASNSKITFPNSSAAFVQTGDFSVGGWVKTGSAGPYVLMGAHSNSDTNHNAGWTVQVQNNGSVLAMRATTLPASNAAGKVVSGVANVGDNAWHFWVFTYTASSQAMILYVDGSPDNSGNGTNGLAYEATTYCTISSDTADGIVFDQWYDGAQDDMFIFNDVLTPTEILSHWNGTDPIAVPLNVDTTGSFIQGVKIVG